MRHILTSVFLIVLLFPALAMGEMVESYYDNGQLRFKGSYKDGMEEGPWVGYNEDGTVWELMTGTYENGVKVK